MKRKWTHPEESDSTSIAWKSAGQFAGSPESRAAMEREFPPGIDSLEDDGNGVTRRNFVRYMGASAALMGLSGVGCRRPEEFIVPFTRSVEWTLPGRPLLYASVRPWAEGAVPLVVTTHEGRPTKLEGNPLHPNSTGTSDTLTQASVLDLYDPDRSKHPLRKGERISKEEMTDELGELRQQLADTAGEGTGFLIGRSSSPTRRRLIEELAAEFPQARWFRYEALLPEGLEAASASAFGEGVRAVTDFTKLDRVLTLDCDFLGSDAPDASAQARFSRRRKPEEANADGTYRPHADMARLYTAEPAMSLTGGMADHRARVPASQIFNFAVLIARQLAAITKDADLSALISGVTVDSDKAPFDMRWVRECAVDLASTPGRSAIMLGSRHSETAHLLVIAMNKALGAYGDDGCIELFESGDSKYEDLRALHQAIDVGEVKTLIATTPANPAYDAPADFKWPELRDKLERFVHLGFNVNHSAIAADLHLPGTCYLEEWGDVRDNRGVYSIIQPMILPLYGGISENTLFLHLLSDEPLIAKGEDNDEENDEAKADPVMLAVRETLESEWQALGGEGDFKNVWSHTLRDGFLAGSAYPKSNAAVAVESLPGAADHIAATPTAEALELVFTADASVYDGRFINNGWLQEMPDPVSKLTWDNAALISPTTAKALGVFMEYRDDLQKVPMIELSVDGTSIEIPVLIAFGQADFSISLPMGYGQLSKAQSENSPIPMSVGVDCGFDVNPLRRLGSPYIATAATSKPANKLYEVALLQEHSTIFGRAIVREGTLERYKEDPEFAAFEAEDSHIPENISLYKNEDKEGNPQINDPRHQWAMVIDLNQCTGCNACLVACQAENNIPIVGKEQVRLGRAMHWIRMDRYFVAQQDANGRFQNEDNPEMLIQPVACMHCEKAPCTTVCPVNATITGHDSLNLMAYNRCIGTRYCANNCPWKVRRFNFFDYNKRPLDELYRGPLSSTKGVPLSKQLQKNPNVSVRMRGVMEKCTYCIQRLEAAKYRTSRRRRDKPREVGKYSSNVTHSPEELRLPTDSVKVACQQACPTEAIVFGNLLDPKSAVRKLKFIDEDTVDRPIVSKHPRNYETLKYIGALPRTSYLARIRNVNPQMPDARYIGNSTIHLK